MDSSVPKTTKGVLDTNILPFAGGVLDFFEYFWSSNITLYM